MKYNVKFTIVFGDWRPDVRAHVMRLDPKDKKHSAIERLRKTYPNARQIDVVKITKAG